MVLRAQTAVVKTLLLVSRMCSSPLSWCGSHITLETFVLVDDEGKLLAKGTPQQGSDLPHIQQRKANFDVVRGGRY